MASTEAVPSSFWDLYLALHTMECGRYLWYVYSAQISVERILSTLPRACTRMIDLVDAVSPQYRTHTLLYDRYLSQNLLLQYLDNVEYPLSQRPVC
jgi:hypothetical protein